MREMPVKRDQMRSAFGGVGGDPNVVDGNRSAGFVETVLDGAKNVGGFQRAGQYADGRTPEKVVQLRAVLRFPKSASEPRVEFSEYENGHEDGVGTAQHFQNILISGEKARIGVGVQKHLLHFQSSGLTRAASATRSSNAPTSSSPHVPQKPAKSSR